MSTPLKQHVCAIFPSTQQCVSCSTASKLRYYILKLTGEEGPSLELASDFYQVSFKCTEHFGCYLCKSCYRLIGRINDTKTYNRKLCDSVHRNTQTLQIRSSKKRIIARTPKKGNKRPSVRLSPKVNNTVVPTSTQSQISKPSPAFEKVFTASGKDFEDIPKSIVTVFTAVEETDQELSESFPSVLGDSLISESADQTTCCGVSVDNVKRSVSDINTTKTLATSKRTDLVFYKSVNVKRWVVPTVKLLSNGSIQAAIKSLLHNKSTFVQKEVASGICTVLNKECSDFTKKSKTVIKTKPSNLSEFEILELQREYEQETALTWQLLSGIGKNKKSESDKIEVTAACSVLFHSRSVTLNALQHVVSISLYNNQLQKEGFLLLSKLGITTTHATLNNALSTVKNEVNKNLQFLKYDLEINAEVACNSVTEHCDHNYTGHQIQHTATTDHNYLQQVDSNAQIALNLGYRFNIDNLDFLIKILNMTQEHQNQLKHYVQLMAIKDRVNCENLIDDRSIGNLSMVPNPYMIPEHRSFSQRWIVRMTTGQ